MKHLLTTTAAAAVIFWAMPSHAVLQFSALVGGNPIACQDQNAACDTNPAVGILQTNPLVFGGVSFLGSSQTSTTSPVDSINTTSFQITNTTGAPIAIQIAVGNTNYDGPVTVLSQSGSGTFQNAVGSSIELVYYADTANTQGADTPTDFPGVLQADSGVILATTIADSFNFDSTSAFVDANLYSMTIGTTGTLAAGGSLVGRSQTQITVAAVPEPASLLILGGSLTMLGLIAARRRRNQS